MARLPDTLLFLRPFIHRVRMATRDYPILRFFYEKARIESRNSQVLNPEVDALKSQFLNLLDRFAVLESSLNWRLYGIPARIENISLEQLPLLAGTDLVRQAVQALSKGDDLPTLLLEKAFDVIPPDAKIFLVGHETAELSKIVAERTPTLIFNVLDPSDLFSSLEKNSINRSREWQVIRAPVLDAAARFTRPEFDFVWMSAAIERLTSVQIQAFFISLRSGLSEQGKCSGVFADYAKSDPGLYWVDPRRLRPLTQLVVRTYAENAGFSNVTFTEDSSDIGIRRVLFEIS